MQTKLALNSQRKLSVSASGILGLKVCSITSSACVSVCVRAHACEHAYVQVSTEPRHRTSPGAGAGAGGNCEAPGVDCEN